MIFTKKNIIVSLAIAAVAASSLSVTGCSKSKDEKIIEAISNWANSFKKQLPMKLNDEISMTDIKVGPSKRLEYVYQIAVTAEDYKKVTADYDNFVQLQQNALNNVKTTYCNSKEMKPFVKDGVAVHYTYLSKEGSPLFEIEDFDGKICGSNDMPKIKVNN